MTGEIQFPAGLWEQPLFQASAEYAPPTAPLLAARLDARLRRLRHMPSTADETPARLLEGLERLEPCVTAWLSRNGDAEPWVMETLARLDRLRRAAERGLGAEGFRDSLSEICGRLDEQMRAFVAGFDLAASGAVLPAIRLLRLLVLERGVLASSRWRRPYLRRVYRIVDEALAYNSTTDAARYVPVLSWVRHVLATRSARACAYVDVGCAALQRAPGLVLAGRLLREQGFCAPCLHGTDVRLPPRPVLLDLLSKHRIVVYGCDPVLRPLPRRYDAMLLANVHRHLPVALQRQLLVNLAGSLSERGLVFVTWRFDARNSPGLCLERRGNSLVLIHQTNVV
jgi:hypothetical protein